MTDRDQTALQLCETGLQHMWRDDVEAALAAYDRALVAAESEETRELVTIRKAEALIAAEREGSEVAALPAIVLRRRSPRHVYLAAGTLMRRFVELDDRRRAIFYGEIARGAAAELNEPLAYASVLNHLGITLLADSQFPPAIAMLNDGLATVANLVAEREEAQALEASLLVNIGGANVLCGKTAEGLRILEAVLSRLEDDYTVAEACLDLCFGHMQLEHYELAESYGRRALGLASVKRQVRNANHLLAEVCLRMERYDESDEYFEVVASFYPEFRNVKQLLVAVDLCSVINWKA